MTQPSPYTPGEIAREVPGRRDLLDAVAADVARLTNERRIVGRPRIFHGPRGYGKTSLLRAAEAYAHTQDVASIWVTAEEASSLALDLIASFDATATSHRLGKDVRQAVEGFRLGVSAGLPGGLAKAEITYQLPASREPATPSQTRDFERLVQAMTEGLLQKGKRGLVLFVDEVQNSDRRGLQLLSYGLAHLAATKPQLPFAVVAAGLPSTPVAITSAVSNSERFAYTALTPLPELDVKRALADPAYALGVTWDPPALDAAAAWAAGYPYSVQLVGQQTWEAAGWPDRGGSLGIEAVDAGILAAAEELEHLHAARLGRIYGEIERQFLLAMAALGDGPVDRSAIAERMGRSSASISNQRAGLIGKGIIEPTGHGRLAFTVPGFAAYLREHGDDAG